MLSNYWEQLLPNSMKESKNQEINWKWQTMTIFSKIFKQINSFCLKKTNPKTHCWTWYTQWTWKKHHLLTLTAEQNPHCKSAAKWNKSSKIIIETSLRKSVNKNKASTNKNCIKKWRNYFKVRDTTFPKISISPSYRIWISTQKAIFPAKI